LFGALRQTPVVLGFGYLAMALSARTSSVLVSVLCTVPLLMFSVSPLLLGPAMARRGSPMQTLFNVTDL
jgi:hypothetical protein